ncbi:MAG: hypothetical protein HY908_12365, partial [Myxococcales bacterium]|nr:hypothetical protein [Myxococcales bacterium]
ATVRAAGRRADMGMRRAIGELEGAPLDAERRDDGALPDARGGAARGHAAAAGPGGPRIEVPGAGEPDLVDRAAQELDSAVDEIDRTGDELGDAVRRRRR